MLAETCMVREGNCRACTAELVCQGAKVDAGKAQVADPAKSI